jgi:hypothetical protein
LSRALFGALATLLLLAPAARAADGDWRDDAPGKVHRLSADALPQPYDTHSAFNQPRIVARPAGAAPIAAAGYAVALFTDKLEEPRLIRVAPNGDIFVAESNQGRVRVLRAAGDGGKPTQIATFAEGLEQPLASPSFRPGPIPNSSISAIPTRCCAFPTATVIWRRAASPKRWCTIFGPAAGTGRATSPSRATASGCSSRSDRARTSPTAW